MLKKEIKINAKIIFLSVSIALLLPTIYYVVRGAGIFNLVTDFSFFYLAGNNEITIPKIIGTGAFLLVFILLFVLYLKIVKKEAKLFQTNQSLACFVILISIVFACVLPMNSTDIFYYMGTGWSEAKYDVNPYYTSVEQVIQENEEAKRDEILLKTPKIWRNDTVVYGPVWPMICKVLSGLSAGSLPLALAIYKLFNLMIHLFNCYILHKMTKKKKFVLLYALNPLILFAGLAEGHNDILVVGMILLALYFFKKKKNIWMSVVILAIATAIKYYAVLLIPFLILYHYRKEKVGKRILYASGWAFIFVGILAGMYLVYMRDISVFAGIQEQQGKFANTFFVPLAIKSYAKAKKLNNILMIAYVAIYGSIVLKLLWQKRISFVKNMRIYNGLLLAFIFLTITNFQAWYVMWLFSTLLWQRGKMIKSIINISIAVELANAVYFLLSQSIQYAQYYSFALIATFIILEIINNKKEKKTCKMIPNKIK